MIQMNGLNPDDVIRFLRSLRCWVPYNSTARAKINEFIQNLTGSPEQD